MMSRATLNSIPGRSAECIKGDPSQKVRVSVDIHNDIHANTDNSTRISTVSRKMHQGYPKVSPDIRDGTDNWTRISTVTWISLRISVRTRRRLFDSGEAFSKLLFYIIEVLPDTYVVKKFSSAPYLHKH